MSSPDVFPEHVKPARFFFKQGVIKKCRISVYEQTAILYLAYFIREETRPSTCCCDTNKLTDLTCLFGLRVDNI